MADIIAGPALAGPAAHPPRFAFRTAVQLALAGLPIGAYIFSDTLLRTIDGAVIAHYLGDYSMGLYSVAMQMGSYLFAIPEAMGFVLWPRIMRAYGAANGDAIALRRQVVLPTLVVGCFMPILTGVAYVLLPPLVWDVLPKYHLSIGATQILAMASVFLALPMPANSLMIAHSREATAVLAKLVGAAISGLGCYWLTHHSGTLEQLAMAAATGYMATALLSIAIVLPQYETSPLRRASLYVGALAPFLWACAALATSHALAGLFMAPDPYGWKWSLLRVSAFGLLMLPVAAFGNRRTRLLTELREMVRSWFSAKGEKNDEANA